MDNTILQSLNPSQAKIASDILDLVSEKILKDVYLMGDDSFKEHMKNIFQKGSADEKYHFINDNISDLEAVFQEKFNEVIESLKEKISQKI